MTTHAQPIKHLIFKCALVISLVLCHAAIAPANTIWLQDNSIYIVTADVHIQETQGDY